MEKKHFDLNFRLVLISKTISIVGGNALGFAMILFLVDFTGSAAILGISQAVSLIPTIFLMPFAGMIADRMNKKKLIVAFDVMTALSHFLLLWLLVTGSYTIVNVTLIRMVTTSIGVFAATVFNAAVPRLVEEEQLIAANGALQSIGAVGMISGAVFGGLLFSVLGMTRIALVAGVLFLTSAGVSLLINIPLVKQKATNGMMQMVKIDLLESFRFLKDEKPIVLKLALVSASLTLLTIPILNIGLPYIGMSVFGPQEVIRSFGMAAGGMLVGGMLAKRLTDALEIKCIWKWMAALGGAALLLSHAFSPRVLEGGDTFRMFNIGLVLLLSIFALTKSSLGAFRQKEVPEHLLGKVNSLLGMISLAAESVGMLVIGLLLEVATLTQFFLVLGVVILLLAVVGRRIVKIYEFSTFKSVENST